MAYPYRVGGKRGRRIDQTNYGNIRPGEGMANGQRQYITHLRLTRQQGSTGTRVAGGGSGGFSAAGEASSTSPSASAAPKFGLTIANNTTESFTFGRKINYGLVVCHFLMYRGDFLPATVFAHGKFTISHDGTFAQVEGPDFAGDMGALPNGMMDSSGNLHFTLSAEIDSNLDLVLFVTASNDATIDGGTIRLGVVYPAVYPEIQ